MSTEIIKKFGPVLESIDTQMMMQSSFLESMYNMKTDIDKSNTSLLTKILKAIVDNKSVISKSTNSINTTNITDDLSISVNDSLTNITDSLSTSVSTNTNTTINFLQNVYGQLEKQTGLLENLIGFENKKIDMAKEAAEDRARAEDFEVEKTTPVLPPPSDSTPNTSIENDSSSSDFFVGSFFGNIATALKNIAAIGTAFLAASFGFRGWELKAINPIKSGLNNLTNFVTKGIKSLRDTILVRYFGFTPEGQLGRNITGQFTRSVPISEQIAQRMSDLRARALRTFGLGVDGKPIQVRGANGKFTGTSIVGRVTSRIQDLLRPLRAAASGITRFITGAGKVIFDNPIFKGAGAFAKVVGKILKPLGIIFSAWEGINAFMDKEGTLYEKFSAGVAAALGDFFGAPLDLLKNLGAWVLKKFGFDETAQAIQDFSIEEKLTDLLNGILIMPKKAFDWIKTLFTDPTEALKSLWDTLVGANKTILDIIFFPINKAVQWISGMFEWEEGEDFSLSDKISEWTDDFRTWVSNLLPDLPSIADISKAFYDQLPSWLQKVVRKVSGVKVPEDVVNERVEQLNQTIVEAKEVLANPEATLSRTQRSTLQEDERLLKEIKEEKAKIVRSEAGENEYWGNEEEGRAESLARVQELEARRRSESNAAKVEEARQSAEAIRIQAEQTLEQNQTELKKVQEQPTEVAASQIEYERLLEEKTKRKELEAIISSENAPERVKNQAKTTLGDMPSREDIASALEYHAGILGIEEYAKGSKGFVDFGKGTFAMLHDKEAVVPLETPAGKFLESYFTENWQPKIIETGGNETTSKLAMKTETLMQESSAMQTKATPVVVRGGDNMNKGGDVYRQGDTNTVINQFIDPAKKLNHIPN